MTAIILDGKKFSAQIRYELKFEVDRLKEKGIIPGLAGVLVGEDPGSVLYSGLKSKACEEVGIVEMTHRLPQTASEAELMNTVNELNCDLKVHGIFIQLPLPSHLSAVEGKALDAILPAKDVDGFHAMNVGRAWIGKQAFFPAVAVAIQEVLIRGGYHLRFKNVVIVNVDNMVGKPLAALLLQEQPYATANVTLCHPATPDLAEYTRRADVLVVSVNRPNFITAGMVKHGAVVLDFGGTFVQDPVTKKRKTVGDVDAEPVKEVAGAISPVPGGIGPMLVTMLLVNTIKAAKMANGIV